jgi:hypothetical protein
MSGAVDLPAFDRTAIEAHISLLHDLAEGLDGVLILAAFEAGGRAQVQRFRIGDVDGMVATIMGFENHPNLNLYAPWSVFRRDLEPSKKGSEADVVAVLAAVGDLDNDKYSLGELPVEAPYIVETAICGVALLTSSCALTFRICDACTLTLAVNVAVCVPTVPMRILLDSPALPTFPARRATCAATPKTRRSLRRALR